MTRVNRRTALAGVVAATGTAIGSQDDAAQPHQKQDSDRSFVMAAGMTAAEADCWKKTAEAAAAFFALPVLHQMDKQEVASAIHVLRNKLLARPTYRRYLELAKAASGRE